MMPAGIRPSWRYQASGPTSVSVTMRPVPSSPGFALDLDHAVGEEERRHRHPHLAAVAVLAGEFPPEHLGDAPAGKNLELAPVVRRHQDLAVAPRARPAGSAPSRGLDQAVHLGLLLPRPGERRGASRAPGKGRRVGHPGHGNRPFLGSCGDASSPRRRASRGRRGHAGGHGRGRGGHSAGDRRRRSRRRSGRSRRGRAATPAAKSCAATRARCSTGSRPMSSRATARCGRGAERLGDRPAEDIPRPGFDEDADAVGIGLLDRLRKVDRPPRLVEKRVADEFARLRVARHCATGNRTARPRPASWRGRGAVAQVGANGSSTREWQISDGVCSATRWRPILSIATAQASGVPLTKHDWGESTMLISARSSSPRIAATSATGAATSQLCQPSGTSLPRPQWVRADSRRPARCAS